MKLSNLVALAIGLITATIYAPTPALASNKFLNVQGKVTDNTGSPLAGAQTLTFRLYTSATGPVGDAIWVESKSITLSSGLFNVTLGTSTSLDNLPFDRIYYLGIQIAGDPDELSPRQELGASAYAQGSLGDFHAGGTVDANNITSSGTITNTGGLADGRMLLLHPENGTKGAFLQFVNTGGTFYVGSDNSTGSDISGAAYANVIWAVTNTPTILGTNNIERVRIEGSGNVGIGTSDPSQLLEVFANTTEGICIRGVGASPECAGIPGGHGLEITRADGGNAAILFNQANSTWTIGVDNSPEGLTISEDTEVGNNVRLFIDEGGNVGVGTTSPTEALDVSGRVKMDSVTVNAVEYNWPSVQGSSNQILINDGNGNLSWGARGMPPWILVASATVSGQTSVSFNLPSISSASFRLYFFGKQNSTWGGLSVRFNSDTTFANYQTGVTYNASDGVHTNESGPSAGKCYAGRYASVANAGGLLMMDYMFFGNPSDDTTIDGFFESTAKVGSSVWEFYRGGCHYDGASTITTVQVQTAAGNFSGMAYLYRLE